MPFVTLWTLARKQCVVFVDPPDHHYDLRLIDYDTVLLEQLNISVDDVMPTALMWQRQYSDAVRPIRSGHPAEKSIDPFIGEEPPFNRHPAGRIGPLAALEFGLSVVASSLDRRFNAQRPELRHLSRGSL